jgi:hypothetical protein
MERQKASATATEADREKERQSFRRNLEKSRTDWEEIRLDLDKRSMEIEAWLEQTVTTAQRAITDGLSHELSRVPNPKEWWKEELPYRLNREVAQLSRSVTQGIQSRIGQDMAWFSGELVKRFSWRIPSQHYQEDGQLDPITITPSAEGLPDTKRLQYVTRLAGPTLMALGFILPPLRLVGPLIGAAFFLIGEDVTRKRTAAQKTDLTHALSENIETATRQAILEMRNRVRDFFHQVLDDARRQETVWIEAQQKAAAQINQADASYIGQLDQVIKRVADLCRDINESLSRT